MRSALYYSLILFFPIHAFAAVLITEIMYDLPGTDTGREWFEIMNTGTSAVEVPLYKFYESDTNHALTVFQGTTFLAPGAYAVVAEDPALFAIDNPAYHGPLFDSSWSSFSNEGEVFEIKDQEGVVVDHVAYSKDAGGLGDGMSLHRSGNNFVAEQPSPGAPMRTGSAGAVPSPPPSSTPTQTSSGVGSASSGTSSSTVFFGIPKSTPEPALAVSAGGNRIVLEQVENVYDAKIVGVPTAALPYVQYRWNFGNGEEVLEKAVAHRYVRTGDYVVTLTALSGGKTVHDRIVVSVVAPDLTISSVSSEGIEILNNATRDLDLSRWSVRVRDQSFLFPDNTWILGGKRLFLESRVTKMSTDTTSRVDLYFPNGILAVHTSPLLAAATTTVGVSKLAVPKKTGKVKKSNTSPAGKSTSSVSTKKQSPAVPTTPLETQEKPVVQASDLMVASVVDAVPEQQNTRALIVPLLSLLALIGISSGAVLLLRQARAGDYVANNTPDVPSKERGANQHKTKEADSYTIIE